MATREQIDIEIKTDPSGDIVNKSDVCKFGCLVEYAKVTVNKLGGGGMESYCSKGSAFQPITKDGISCCWGVYYTYSLKSQQESIFVPSFTGLPITKYEYKEGYIKIGVGFEPYTSPPEETQYNTSPPSVPSSTPSETPPDAGTGDPTQETQYITELVPTTTEEWLQSQVVKGGINEKCVNVYAKDILGQGEIKADRNIINPLIPDVETAQRIGDLATLNSEKTQNCSLSIAPNFEMKLGDTIEAETTIADIEQGQRIFNISIDLKPRQQDFVISWMGKEV